MWFRLWEPRTHLDYVAFENKSKRKESERK